MCCFLLSFFGGGGDFSAKFRSPQQLANTRHLELVFFQDHPEQILSGALVS